MNIKKKLILPRPFRFLLAHCCTRLTPSLAHRQLWPDTHFGPEILRPETTLARKYFGPRILRPGEYFGPVHTSARKYFGPIDFGPAHFGPKTKLSKVSFFIIFGLP